MVKVHPHALQRCNERGATLEEVIHTVESGEVFPAKFDRTGFRYNFSFDDVWNAKHFMTKQLEVFATQRNDEWLVITVIVKYF
jgi:hypothetical protein